MKKIALYTATVIVALAVFASCTVSYTTVATPETESGMVVTSGDMPNKDYEVLGFVESYAYTIGGPPTESAVSKMKSNSINDGLVAKGDEMGADAIISVTYKQKTETWYFLLTKTTMRWKGTAIKFK